MKTSKNIRLTVTTVVLLFITVSVKSQENRAIDSLKIALNTTANDTIKANILIRIADELDIKSDYPNAITYALQAKSLFEKINYTRGIAKSERELGIIYSDKKNYNAALYHNNISLNLFSNMNDKKEEVSVLSNIGLIYDNTHNYNKSLEYYFKSLSIAKQVYGENSEDYSLTLNNIGYVYCEIGQYSKALTYLSKSLKISKSIGYITEECYASQSIGEVYLKEKQYAASASYLNRSIELAKELGILGAVMESERLLTELYKQKGDCKNQFAHHQNFVAIRDSIFNQEETEKFVRSEMNFEFEKKQAIAKAEQDKKDFIKKEVIIGISIVLFLMIILAVVMFRNYKRKQADNLVISAKNNELQEKNHIIEESKQEIVSNITYASRIQRAMITSESYIKKNVTDLSLLFQPRDIVSGDFYWAVNHNGKFFVATADSTGHGVSGGMMSMLGMNFLNEIVLEKNITSPEQILNELRTSIISALNPDGSTDTVNDGMDCVLCVYDFENMTMEYAAANNSFHIIRNNEIITLKADKMPVGNFTFEMKSFTLNKIDLQKGDVVYTFTDGYADQFGGEKGKKFKYKAFEQLLLDNASLPMTEQTEVLKNTINAWKKGYEQTDDILVIGIQI